MLVGEDLRHSTSDLEPWEESEQATQSVRESPASGSESAYELGPRRWRQHQYASQARRPRAVSVTRGKQCGGVPCKKRSATFESMGVEHWEHVY